MKIIWHNIIPPFLTMHGSGKLPWGRGLCIMRDQCWATSSLSHPITGWTLTRLTDAGQSSFCSLAATVRHVARERWLVVFWILLLWSWYCSAHWDLWNGTIRACVIRFTLSPVSSQNIRVVVDVSSTIYLRLKPHLVKISSDIVTEYSCQVCILSMMFCRSDRRLCWLG